MAKRFLPTKGTKERAFVDAMRAHTVALHSEWVQASRNQRISALVAMLRELGWAVQSIGIDPPSGYAARPGVVSFLDDIDVVLQAIVGKLGAKNEG